MGNYDIALVSSPTSGKPDAIWFNDSQLQTVYEPSPSSKLPFHRFTTTFAENATNTYLYHQLSDSVLAEELWDGGTSGFWISSNVTIETT